MRAQHAVAAVFAFNGFAFASWAVRIPDLTQQVGSSHAALGIALLCISLGALATMRLSGALSERLGPGLVTAVAATLVSLSVVAPGQVSTVPALCLALAVLGAAGGMLNVAMNSVGVELERLTERPLLPRLHAASSLGGLAGGVGGGLAASVLAPGPHLVAVALVGLALVAALVPRLVVLDRGRRPARRPHVDPGREPGNASGVGPAVVVLGVIAGCAAYGEGAVTDWGALHLVQDLGASSPVAAGGYAAFCLAMASGRLAGGRLLDAFGATMLTAGGSLLAAFGMLVAAHASSVGTAIAGVVMLGLGLANVFPLAIARAGALAGSRGVGLASTIGYGGLLLGPATIGLLAAHVGLPPALTTVSVFAVLGSGLAAGWRTEDRVAVRSSLVQATARSRTWAAPATAGLGQAAWRHGTSLEALVPGLASKCDARPLRDPASLLDIHALFGAPAPELQRA